MLSKEELPDEVGREVNYFKYSLLFFLVTFCLTITWAYLAEGGLGDIALVLAIFLAIGVCVTLRTYIFLRCFYMEIQENDDSKYNFSTYHLGGFIVFLSLSLQLFVITLVSVGKWVDGFLLAAGAMFLMAAISFIKFEEWKAAEKYFKEQVENKVQARLAELGISPGGEE